MILNRKGMTLVETLMSIAISAISIAAIAGIMAKNYGASKDLETQALMDTRHADILHRAGSLKFLRNYFNITESGASSLGNCLKSQGTQCALLEQSQSQVLMDPQGDFNSFYGLNLGKCPSTSSSCIIKQSVKYRWLCPSDNECSELVLDIVTSYAGAQKKRIFQSRTNQLKVPARSLISRGDIDFSCTQSQMLMGINYKTLKAQCAPIAGNTQTQVDMPAKTLGPDIEGNPGASNCSGGISELGLYSSQSQCDGASSPAVEVCTPALMKQLNDLLVKQIPMSVNNIMTTCIDAANPTVDPNMASDPSGVLRFKNTCGNRQCRQMGYTSGRVIEFFGDNATLECRYDKAPAGTNNPCTSLISGSAAPIQSLPMAQSQLQSECIDSAFPTAALNDPSLGPQSMTRFMLTCGNRACVSRGFQDGRVIEIFGGQLQLECYKDLTGLFKSVTSAVDDIANNCIDSAVTTLAANRPDAGGSALERFTSTCGNRYCIKLGYRSGSVKEISPGNVVTLSCVQ